jgi:hypothetical protein
VEELARYHAGLAQTLGEIGISGNQLNEIFSTHLRSQCARCGIHVTGEEIMSVVVADHEGKLPQAKLERLRLGYCAREGCDSDYYTIRFENHPGVDWGMVAAKTFEWLAAADIAAKERARRIAIRRRNRTILRVVAGVIIVCSLLLLRFIQAHGRLPFVKKPSKYQVDPASTRNRTFP